jgi:hypothetical protein
VEGGAEHHRLGQRAERRQHHLLGLGHPARRHARAGRHRHLSDANGTLCTTPALSAGAGSCSATAPAGATDTVTATYSGDGNFYATSSTFAAPTASSTVGASVAGTLGLSVSTAAPNLGAFVAGQAQTYTASLTSNVTSTAQAASLTAVDSSSTFTGHLVNTSASGGPYELASPLQVQASDGGGNGATSTGLQPLSSSTTTPVTLLNLGQPVSNDAVTIGFAQPLGATDPLRTGSYTKTVTFTLSTTTP